jgi:hypothetical protein
MWDTKGCPICGGHRDLDGSCSWCREREWQERRQREREQEQARRSTVVRRTSPGEDQSSSTASGVLGLFGATILSIVHWQSIVSIWFWIGSALSPLLPFGISYLVATLLVLLGLIILGYLAVIVSIAVGALMLLVAIITPIFYAVFFHRLSPGLDFPTKPTQTQSDTRNK